MQGDYMGMVHQILALPSKLVNLNYFIIYDTKAENEQSKNPYIEKQNGGYT